MKTKTIFTLVLWIVCISINAQVKYDSNGRFTIGNTSPYEFYTQTLYGTIVNSGSQLEISIN